MTSQQDLQVAIRMGKFNLEDIANHFTNNILPALPFLEEGKQRQIRQTMRALGEARAQAAEISELNQKLGQVQAKQARLNQECIDLMERGQRVNDLADELLALIREEEARDRDYKNYYAAEVMKIVNRNREYANIYDEKLVSSKTELAEAALQSELLNEEQYWKNEVDKIQKVLDEMQPDVPENILEIMGKEKLEKILEKLKDEVDACRRHLTIF